MPLNFDQHAQKGNHFLNQLLDELGENSSKESAQRILRAVLRTLRNYLTMEENFQLLAQLPVAIKGVYVDGWSPSWKKTGESKKIKGFLAEVIHEEGIASWKDFSNEEEIFAAVKAVFRTIGKFASEGQLKDVEAVLPEDLKQLLRENNVSHKK